MACKVQLPTKHQLGTCEDDPPLRLSGPGSHLVATGDRNARNSFTIPLVKLARMRHTLIHLHLRKSLCTGKAEPKMHNWLCRYVA